MVRVKFQRHLWVKAVGLLLIAVIGCERLDDGQDRHEDQDDRFTVGLDQVAQILSSVQLEKVHLDEVHDAVLASSYNGYDEEYTMKDLFESPGRGVGEKTTSVKSAAAKYSNPLKDVIESHIRSSVDQVIRWSFI